MSTLARKSVGAGGLWFFAVSASAPMTVLAGGVTATYAGTGVIGVPLAFVILTLALWLLTVGYTAMAWSVPHAAPFYALPAQGLGRPMGVACGLVALLAYTAMEAALLGLIGATLAGGLPGSWWVWSAVVWLVVLVCGVLRVDLSASLLAVLLLAEITVVVVFDVAGLAHPAGGHVSMVPWHLNRLAVDGVGGVLALSVAAFVGYETAAAYGEEARDPRATGRATVTALLVLGPFYALSAWALAVAAGPDQVAAAARGDAGLPFTILARTTGVFGPVLADVGRMLLVTSIFAATLSFHTTASRYSFALGRAQVLPGRLARTGAGGRRSRRDAPVSGSLLQTALTAVIVGVGVVAGVDPVTGVFTWLAALAAVAILLLLVVIAVAAIRFFSHGRGPGSDVLGVWQTRIAPWCGLPVGLGVTGVAVWNLDTLLGIAAHSPLAYLIPGLITVTAIGGLIRAGILYRRDPAAYERIGRGRAHDLAVPDRRLNDVLRPVTSSAGAGWVR